MTSDVDTTPRAVTKHYISGEEMNSLLRPHKRSAKKSTMSSPKPVASFQERMVGIKIRHGMKNGDKGSIFGGCVGGVYDQDTPSWGRDGGYGSLVETGTEKHWPKGMRTSTSFTGVDMAMSV